MKKNIFLTGVSGFIGSNLCKKLLLEENRIYGLVRKPTEQLDKRIEIIQGDILRPGSYVSYIKECDIVFHCAAYVSFRKSDFEKAYRINVEGTRNVLEAAFQGRIKKMVHVSACAVLGCSSDENTVLDEIANPAIDRNNVYAYTKKLSEEEVKKVGQKGLNVSIANVATVYGQGDRKLNSGAIIKAIYTKKMKFFPPGGTSFVSVDDLVDGLILLAQKGRGGERYIFSSENMPYRELTQRIARVLNVQGPRYSLPRFTFYPALWGIKVMGWLPGFRHREISLMTPQILRESYGYKFFTSEKARKELNWNPQQNFEEAVGQAFNYYQKNHLI